MIGEPVVIEKKELKKLLELNEELENYFRNTIIPQLFVDADLILRKFSPPDNMHFKLMADDLGKQVNDIPNLSELPEFVASIAEVIANNEDVEKEIQARDNRWFQMNILPYKIKKLSITNGVVITFIDITGRINDKQDIERINADHETFIYSVSHDFRGPLTNMVLLVELLKAELVKDDKNEINVYVEKIEKSVQLLKSMINELTDITKIGNDVADQPCPVNIDQILEEVKFTLKNQIYQSHAKITTHISVAELLFPRKNLSSIMYNLLSNALKYAKPNITPEIFIKTELVGEYALLSVKDNGIGIEAERHNEIFSKFSRLRPHIEGTGIGLFIVNKMVINTGGKIEVDSKPDMGTTFTIYLKNKQVCME